MAVSLLTLFSVNLVKGEEEQKHMHIVNLDNSLGLFAVTGASVLGTDGGGGGGGG